MHSYFLEVLILKENEPNYGCFPIQDLSCGLPQRCIHTLQVTLLLCNQRSAVRYRQHCQLESILITDFENVSQLTPVLRYPSILLGAL